MDNPGPRKGIFDRQPKDRVNLSHAIRLPNDRLTDEQALDFYDKHLKTLKSGGVTTERFSPGKEEEHKSDEYNIPSVPRATYSKMDIDGLGTRKPPSIGPEWNSATMGPPPCPPKEIIDGDESYRAVANLKRKGKEWYRDSTYKGSRQPPLGIRIQHVLNFLREEDVDRCLDWKSKFGEVVEYLDWLAKDDPDKQLDTCGLEVRNMYKDALIKVKIHKAFEEHHYGRSVLEFKKTSLPRPPRRPEWLSIRQDRPIRLSSIPLDGGLEPRPLLLGPARPVNTMFPPGNWEGANFRTKMATAEKAFFASEKGRDTVEDGNIFLIENQTYENLCEKGMGWIKNNGPSTNEKFLPDGTPLHLKDNFSYARERGARRAGLQQILRSLPAEEHRELMTSWRRITLPFEHWELDRVCKEADKNLQWEPFRLGFGQMPLQLETMPYTFWWREYVERVAPLRKEARKEAIRACGNRHDWVTLPKNIDSGGPFVWRAVNADVEAAMDLLRDCEATYRMLQRAEGRASGKRRVLLVANNLCRTAAEGGFGWRGNRQHENVNLRQDEWDGAYVGSTAKSVAETELLWLKFLSGGYTTAQLQGAGKLLSIFAKRVERVVQDPNPDAPFWSGGGTMSVEALLEAVNKGCDGPVRKTKFTVRDAMCWLPKLADLGLVTFKRHPACYGIIGYPDQNVYPEDRIDISDNRDPIPRWHNIRSTKVLSPKEQQQRVERFFFNLGFRLGLTLYRLRAEAAEKWSNLSPLSLEALGVSADKAEEKYNELVESGDRGQIPTLQELVKRANPMDYRDDMTDKDIFALVRSKIVEESVANLTMLAPGRAQAYQDEEGNTAWKMVRDHNWDWASEKVRGKAKRFWSLDRWPVDFQSEKTRQRIRNDSDIDPRMVWDPRAEDSTEGTVVRPKLRRFGQPERVRHRPGPAIYSLGDTPLQRREVKKRMTEMVAEAMGINTRQPSNKWSGRLSQMFNFVRRSSPDEDVPLENSLPNIDRSLIPVSWDPQAAADEDIELPDA